MALVEERRVVTGTTHQTVLSMQLKGALNLSLTILSPNVAHANLLVSILSSGGPYAPRLNIDEHTTLFHCFTTVEHDGISRKVVYEIIVQLTERPMMYKTDCSLVIPECQPFTKENVRPLFEYGKHILCQAYLHATRLPSSTSVVCKPHKVDDVHVHTNEHLHLF